MGSPFNLKNAVRAIVDAFWGLVTLLIVVVGVVTGIVTATESAALAVVWSLMVGFFVYKELTLIEAWHVLERALGTLAIVMI